MEPLKVRPFKPKPQKLEQTSALIDAETPRDFMTGLAEGEFRVEISQPRLLRSDNPTAGRMLRFTLTWVLRSRDLGLLGCSHNGCLFMRTLDGRGWRWSLPTIRRGAAVIHNYMIFPDFYTYVLKSLISRFGEQVGPEDVRFLA